MLNRNNYHGMIVVLFTLLMSVFPAHASRASAGWETVSHTVAKVSDQSGVDVQLLAAIGFLESSFRTSVGNQHSSAKGMFQFTNRTWRVTLEQYGELYGLDSTADKADPYASTAMAAEYIKENADIIRRRLGREPTDTEVYMSHLLSPQRVVHIAKQNPRRNIALMYPTAARNNKRLFYTDEGYGRTIAQFYAVIEQRVNNAVGLYGELAEEALARHHHIQSIDWTVKCEPEIPDVDVMLAELSERVSTIEDMSMHDTIMISAVAQNDRSRQSHRMFDMGVFVNDRRRLG